VLCSRCTTWKKGHPGVSISMKTQSKMIEAFKVLDLDASRRLQFEDKEANQHNFLTALINGKVQ